MRRTNPFTNHRKVIYGKTRITSTFFVASAVLKTVALFLEIKFGINFVNTFSNKSSKCQRKEKSNTETVP